MTTQSTRHRAVVAAALLAATGLTLSGCNNGGAPPTDSTSTASGPSSSTMSQEEQDLTDAVEVTKTYYSDQVKGDLREPSPSVATDDFIEGVKSFRDEQVKSWDWKGPRDKVLWVKASQRGQRTVTTRVCYQTNRLAYQDGTPALVTPDGTPLKAGDRREHLISLVPGGDSGWLIDEIQLKGKC